MQRIQNVEVLDETQGGMRRSPDRFLSSIFEDPGRRDEHLEKSSNIHLSSRLPAWLCKIIAVTLGTKKVNQAGESHLSEGRALLATFLHIITMVSGLCFGASGLYFNVFDTLSEFTKTTVLVSLSRCVIGLYWIMLGVYSHSLAAKLIGNPRVVDCIRLHSKTFMKVNMVFVIAMILTSVLCLNFYTNVYMLKAHSHANQTTPVYKADCDSIGVNIFLCKIYFGSKVVYSLMSLIWNLMVAAICLSICRTLTIGIRRFIRELNFDSHIYEEYMMVQSYERHLDTAMNSRESGIEVKHFERSESWTIWDDDIKDIEVDSVFQLPSSRENILKELRYLRRRKSGQDSPLEVSVNNPRFDFTTRTSPDTQYPERNRERVRITSGSSFPESIPENAPAAFPEQFQEEVQHPQDMMGRGKPQRQISDDIEPRAPISPPIISNDDLMFTYFKLNRRLQSTSRLLQRWMSSWITFILLWSVTLIIYWVSHGAGIIDLLEFLLPLVGIGLMSSAYAEVNFEGARVLNCLLPTVKRLPIISYIRSAGLELKIFSFVMTYNIMVTVVAGVTLTIATRIIIEQIE